MTEACPPDPEGITWYVNHRAHDPHDLNGFVPWAVFSIMLYCVWVSVCVKVNSIIFLILPTKHEILHILIKVEFE